MKTHPLKLKHSLLLALLIFTGSSMAYSQCLVYSYSQKYSESGFKSHSGVNKGYVILGPKQIMQDGLTRYEYVSFDIQISDNSFNYSINTPKDGNPSSGGLLIGLVKQGAVTKVLATQKSAGQGSDWNPFDSSTLSGTASFKPGYGYIARILSATVTGWMPNYYYYNFSDNTPDIGNSTSTDPINVYKWTSTDTYTLQDKYTTSVAGMTLLQARDYGIKQLRDNGYKDNTSPQ